LPKSFQVAVGCTYYFVLQMSLRTFCLCFWHSKLKTLKELKVRVLT